MKDIYILLLFAFIYFAQAETFPALQDHKWIVESNYYESDTQARKNWTLSNIKQNKPLVFHLKKKKNHQYKVEQHHLKVSFSNHKSSQQCTLRSITSVCVTTLTQELPISIEVQCSTLPCQLSWIIYQLGSIELSSGQLNEGLYSLAESNDHLVVELTCNDPQNKKYKEDVSFYSTSRFSKGELNNKLYYLFDNQQKGFIYVDIDERSQGCTQIKILNVPKELKYGSIVAKDFANKHSSSSFRLNNSKSDFRLDCNVMNIDNSQFDGKISVKLKGYADNETIHLSQYEIEPLYKDHIVDFSITFKQPSVDYEYLELQIGNNQQKMIIISLQISQDSVQLVELSERNYFSLKKDQFILYNLVPDPQASKQDQVYFLPAISDKLTFSQNNCSQKNGCSFNITANQAIQTHIYFSSTPQVIPNKIQYLPLVKTVKRKIKQNQIIYFKKIINSHNAFEVAVNNPNILLYAAFKQKCEKPNSACNQRNGNYLHPFAYTPKSNGQFIIAAEGLESGEFTLTIIDEADQFIHLEDGVAFRYRIEQQQNDLQFRYKLAQKMEVSFNLIAPLNHLLLTVYNGDGDNIQSKSIISSQGFITIFKEDITSLNFIITVKKTTLSQLKMTHFTLIASTEKSVIRLDPTVPHYQTMISNAKKQYIFEYNPSEDYTLNFYSHNLPNQQIHIMLALSNDRVWNQKNLQKIYIDRESDYLDLKQFSGKLCLKEDEESCQIFILLRNQMDIEVDIQIILMTRNSIIQLKDGLWQSYPANTVASTSYFYFYPKHIDRNVVIVFIPNQQFQLTYTVWKTDSKSLNPTKWPFPFPPKEAIAQNNIRQAVIDKQALIRQCWPSCLVLITVYRKNILNDQESNGYLRLMVSNYQIQLPQKTRISLSLKKDEQKQLIVDLKNILDQDSITFYTSRLAGLYDITVNTISQKNTKCHSQNQPQFIIKQQGQTIISVDLIKFNIRNYGMQKDGNLYLCILVQAGIQSKFSIQYISGKNPIQQLQISTSQEIQIAINQSKYLSIAQKTDFILKISRKSGYPFMLIRNCSQNKIVQCRQQILGTNQTGKQLAHKINTIQQSKNEDRIYYIKFYAFQSATIKLYLGRKNQLIDLEEGELLTDYVEREIINSYKITHVESKDLMINIHVIEGDIQAKLTNYYLTNLIKNTSSSNKSIHFYISIQFISIPHKKDQDVDQYFYSNTFNKYQVIIQSINPNSSATYSITYSTGENRIKLQDGLITQINIPSNSTYRLQYQNERSNSHIYFILQTPNQKILSLLQTKSYYYEIDKNNPEIQNKVSFQMQIPTMKKKMANPTLLLSFPNKNYFEIELTNPTLEIFTVTLGIVHQQLIILPLNRQFPFTLHEREDLNFIVDISSKGYAEIQIRKCDLSQPLFSYGFQYDSFLNEQFSNNIELKEEPVSSHHLAITQPSKLYMNMKAISESTTFTIQVKFHFNSTKTKIIKAGNRGLIEYQFISAKKVQISFALVLCVENCEGIKYFSLSHENLSKLYSQFVCPSNFFAVDSLHTNQSISIKQIIVNQSSKIVNFSYQLPHHSSYLVIKAVTKEGKQIFYEPIEIVTIWGHFSKTSQAYRFTIISIILASVCSLLLFVRYNARRGYKKIQQETEESL